MKVFIDTDTLVANAKNRANNLADDLLELTNKYDTLSFWVSAYSLPHVQESLSQELGTEQGMAEMNHIRKSCSVIPLRTSTFDKDISPASLSLDAKIQAASASTLNMELILTKRPECFAGCEPQAISPEDLLSSLEKDQNSIDRVPFLDLTAQHPLIYNEIDDRLTECIETNGFILGKHVSEFESAFADIQGAKYCLGVSSGTDALHVALAVLDIGPGDGVIVPANTFIASAEAVSLCGAVPIFIDCDQYYNIDTSKVRSLLETNAGPNGVQIKAIMPVHLYGQPANMDEICSIAEEYGLKIVEDCCQAHLAELHGKKVGNFGDFGAFSFYPGKNLGAYGEAGALITNDEELFKKADMYRQHGASIRYHHTIVGHNYRMEGFQGAVLAAKVKHIANWSKCRNQNAMLYNSLLGDIEGIEIPIEMEGTSCVYHLYVIQTNERDELQKYLSENGVDSGLHYPIPLHLQEAYEELGYSAGEFPVAEKDTKRILSLPMYPELTGKQIEKVAATIKKFFNK